MFKKNQYINEFNKSTYQGIKLRIRKDDLIVLNRLHNNENKNKYIRDLIFKDAINNIDHNFIDNDVKIDFELSKTMSQLVKKAEEADYLNDYGLYMNIVDAIDSQAKFETSKHILKETNWKILLRRFTL